MTAAILFHGAGKLSLDHLVLNPLFFKNLEKLLEIRNTYKHNELRAEKKNNFPI
jgi:hypothetical protein